MRFENIFALSSYKIARFFIYLALVTPLIVAVSMFFPFVAGKAIYFRVVVELALVFFFFYFLGNPGRVKESVRHIFKNPLFIAATFFVGAYLLTNITGNNFFYSFFSNFERGDGGFELLHVYTFFFLLLALFPTEKDWMRLFKFSLGVSVLVALYAVGQKFQEHEAVAGLVQTFGIIGDKNRPPGPLGNPSYLSVYTMFHFLFALFVVYREKAQWQRFMWIGVVGLNFYAFLNAQTRGTILGLGVAMFVGLLILSFRSRPRQHGEQVEKEQKHHKEQKETKQKQKNIFLRDSRWVFRALLVLLVFSGIFFVATRTSLDVWSQIPGIKRFAVEELFNPLQDDSFRSRYLTWTSAFAGFLEKPILGWGAEHFPYVFDKYYNPLRYGSESWFDRAHNFVLDYLNMGGILLLGAYLAMFYVFYQFLISRTKIKESEDGTYIVPHVKQPYLLFVALMAVPLAYLVQNLFLFDVLPVYIVLFVTFAFTIHVVEEFSLVPAWEEVKNYHYDYSILYRLIAGVVAVFIGFSLYYTAYLPRQKNLLIRESMAISSQNPVKGIAAFKETLDYYSPVGQEETIEQIASHVTSFFSTLLRNQRGLSQEAAPQTIDFANEVLEYAKKNDYVISVKPLFLYGVANLQAGLVFQNPEYMQKAKEIMLEGHEMSPTRFEFIFGLLDLAAQTRDKELGQEMLKKARELRPDMEERYKKYEEILNTF